MERTLTGITTPGQSGPWSNGNEGILHILHNFRTGVSHLDTRWWGITLQHCSLRILQPQEIRPLKSDHLIYLGSNISPAENDFHIHLSRACTAIRRLSTIWTSDLSDKIKREFFQAVSVLLLLYSCTPLILTKRKMGTTQELLHAVFKKTLKQHSTKQ